MDIEGQSETEVAKYLEACNLVFEKGLLSHCRVNNLQSPVLANIRNGMQYFEGWCSTHSQTGMMPIFLQATCKCNMDITSFLTWYCNLFCSTCPPAPPMALKTAKEYWGCPDLLIKICALITLQLIPEKAKENIRIPIIDY